MLTEAAVNLIHSYKNSLNSYDEVLDAKGQIKPVWLALFVNLQKLGLEELIIRNHEIIGKLKENGVTYNVYESPDGESRPWRLDPIPFLIEQKEWTLINRGVEQRARLLDLILKDLYGEQKLVKNAVIPAELVFANTGFFRPCMDIFQDKKNFLPLFAADMARGPDGRMWIVDNRTQAPSGSGYALENRLVTSKLLPELAEGMHINKLSPYFNGLQQRVLAMSEKGQESSNVIYLTPGPKNESYFEHAYLASYLGYTLAQGEDLQVRNNTVYLKSLDGLQRVDVILRRIDDDWCDPLELREDSRLGVPGLLQAMRMGNVRVMNPPGVSLVENHAFLAFMPSICRYFFGEDLIMPSVATWWCGHEKELKYVLANLNRLIIKKANRKSRFPSIYGRRLTEKELFFLRKQISAAPHEFVAQEEVSLSTTPSLIDGQIVPRYAALRTFLVSDGAGGYRAMDGGLTRSSPIKDRFVVSNQKGGLSKDTWIVSDDSHTFQEKVVLPHWAAANKLVSLPSRSAENLFWVGRYCERAMAVIKFMNIVINVVNLDRNFAGISKPGHIKILLEAFSHLSASLPGFVDDAEKLADPYKELLDVFANRSRPGSVASGVASFLNAVNAVRNQWDIEIWRIIDLIENSYSPTKDTLPINKSNLPKRIDSLYNHMFTFLGVVSETMPRDKSYLLLETGKLIERVLGKLTIIRHCFSEVNDDNVEEELVEAVLLNHHQLVQYRQLYKSRLGLVTMLDMVLLEKSHPFSIVNMLAELKDNLHRLPHGVENERLNAAEKAASKALLSIQLAEVMALADPNSKDDRLDLCQLLDGVSELVTQVSVELTSQYFSHSVMQNSFIKPIDDEEI
ncbi:putative circularly permuted ATP-grasp superfamily protein [Dyadobacter jejuensis]|uniref:Putative circularly permuted ATP-grasp superfamily protein n=1 Tax=Dyadobacter jejuensis TaxID=1082580 RepID=A0A316ARH8_9BACT|nr:circularly permuted type 2 ATP-grasp protein [Dyadobacter jejuensis]PWJ60118.1 putative circularly permuted ATP-grasp superfamily protein [Dyadobacter jejuensis]